MTKLYKYGFWFFLVCTLSFFNLWRITKNGSSNENLELIKYYDNRLESLLLSNIITNRDIHIFTRYNVITGVSVKTYIPDSLSRLRR